MSRLFKWLWWALWPAQVPRAYATHLPPRDIASLVREAADSVKERVEAAGGKLRLQALLNPLAAEILAEFIRLNSTRASETNIGRATELAKQEARRLVLGKSPWKFW